MCRILWIPMISIQEENNSQFISPNLKLCECKNLKITIKHVKQRNYFN